MSEHYVMYRETRKGETKVMRVYGANRGIALKMRCKGYIIREIFSLPALIKAHKMKDWEFAKRYNCHRIDRNFVMNIHFDKNYRSYNVEDIPKINEYKINLNDLFNV